MFNNEYRIYVGKISRQFRLLIWNSFIGQLVHPVGGECVILAICDYQFNRVHENLLQINYDECISKKEGALCAFVILCNSQGRPSFLF